MFEHFKEKRIELGMTQAQLARKSGVSRQTISSIENGRGDSVIVGTLMKIESVLFPYQPKKRSVNMLKNMVIVKHLQDNGKFLFYVPKGIELTAGGKVVCDTSRGNDQLGVCCCDSFTADPDVVCPLFGVSPKGMKYVTGRIEYEKFEEALNEEEYEEALGDDE